MLTRNPGSILEDSTKFNLDLGGFLGVRFEGKRG